MLPDKKKLKLGLLLEGAGRTFTDWAHANAVRDAGSSFDFHRRQTQLVEQGKFHFVFLADQVYCEARSEPHALSRLEPIALLSALAVATQRIGLVGTVSTTFSHPYTTARQMATIDHISGGRAGWNVVTSDPNKGCQNYGGVPQLSHADRYRMAREYVGLATALWDSWEDDAFVQDKEKGIFFDPAKMHTLNHKGEFFQVQGPLNIRRAPQGYPLLLTATFSKEGRVFAGECVEGVFSIPENLPESQDLYRQIKAAAINAGRNPEHVIILPTCKPIVGSTEEETAKLVQERRASVSFEQKLRYLGKWFKNHDFSVYDPDGQIPLEVIASGLIGHEGEVERIEHATKVEKLSLRQIAERFGQPVDRFAGTPQQIADEMELWLREKGADGFIMGEPLPGQLKVFVEEVVPLLQRRGLFHEDYEGATLRENLGLPRPKNRFAAKA
ncbi:MULTISPECIES: NtaA/DmoA family FMN-dependent monooxygenase [unclassified Neorhizobium]|uniref:NtaA/DmoA family FMN-dependent monooxygenase n=1 Tax=unclassified Neorhizobium TaxID=2629175 RepID=UPI001FF27AE8|nr:MULTISPECIES: NtaA/DmoA family FMN-dependent monooxygenase [unclassified Neorhizobium]MCJ9670377.1 NtaA/DmoA family FMN-dependent monooxygenase [Neorhizobium sp. SHOUNA12B]MCJ9746309.1 NtaA/DmoA family FMN-dependent monooxygenase [Neorhizobium sp. SHOUNA12A]